MEQQNTEKIDLQKIYEQMGIDEPVYRFGEKIAAELKPRFDAIDQVAEYNQLKVIAAMQKNRVSAECFNASADMDTTIWDVTPLNRYMRTYFMHRRHWCGHRSPAEHMHWHWH